MSNNKFKDKIMDIVAILILAILCVVFFENSNLVRNIGGDTGNGAYAVFAGMAKIINNGEYPLWNPFLWGGMTEAGNAVAQPFYPITYILCKVCYDSGKGMLSYNIVYYQIILHISILAIGFYTLFRNLEFRRSICLAITIMATFSGCAFQMRGWIYIYSGLVYIPMLIAAFIYLVHNMEKCGIKSCCILGVVLGISGLAATSHGSLFNLLVFGIIFLCYLWKFRKEKKRMLTLTKKSVFAGLLGIGIMAISLLPFIEFIADSYRSTDTGEVINGIERMSYDSFISNVLIIADMQKVQGYNGWIAVGSVLLILFFIGLFCSKEKKGAGYWSGIIITIFSVMYCFGIMIPQIMYYIPFYNNIREPYLYSFLFVVGVSIVAAYGLDEIWIKKEEREKEIELHGGMICILLLLLIFLLPLNFTWGKLFIVMGIIFIIFAKFMMQYKVYNTCVIAIVLLMCSHEYFSFIVESNGGVYEKQEVLELVENVNEQTLQLLGNELPNREDAYRVMQWTTRGNAYFSNIWSVWGVNESVGYMNPLYSKMMNIHSNWALPKRAMLQNIRYIMCTTLEDEDYINWLKACGLNEVKQYKNIYSEYDGNIVNDVRVFENVNRLGNAWFVNECIPYSNDTDIEELNNIINGEEFDGRNMALLNTDTYKGVVKERYTQSDEAEIVQTEYGANIVRLSIKASDEAFIVTSEVMAPGWKVYIDGKKGDIIEVNTFFRGVIVDAGEHEIVFKYLPISVILGAMCSIISLMIVCSGIIVPDINKWIRTMRSKCSLKS